MKERGLRVGRLSETNLATRAVARFLVAPTVWCGLLFGAAGTLAWGQAWVHLGLCVITAATNLMVLLWRNPGTVVLRNIDTPLKSPTP